MRSLDVERTVRRAVALRSVAGAIVDPVERRRLDRVIHELRLEIGVGVPKRRAAGLLGVSVQALERWIERGLLAVARKPGSAREQVDTEALIVLLEEVDRRREAGEDRGVVAASLRELDRTGRLPRKLRPNQTARELRHEFLETSPQERLSDVAELSHTAVALAAAGDEARQTRRKPSGLAISHDRHTPPRFFELLRVLCEHRVEFVLIGGFAVALHGYVRATKDIDIVPEQSRENLARLWEALTAVDAIPGELEDFCPEEMPVDFSLEGLIEGGGNWAIHTRRGRIDVMQWVKGVDGYAELRTGAEEIVHPSVGHPILIAGVDDLIVMKEAAGRDVDRIDITALRMAQGLEE